MARKSSRPAPRAAPRAAPPTKQSTAPTQPIIVQQGQPGFLSGVMQTAAGVAMV